MHRRRRNVRPPQRAVLVRASALCVGMAAASVFGCAGDRIAIKEAPGWANSAITARERVAVMPAMSMAERLAELRRAKEAAYQQLIEAVYALPLTETRTVDAVVASRPHLRPQVDAYVRRSAVLESRWQEQQMEVQATVEVGAELLSLLDVKPPALPDRTAPSTGIVRPQ
ncbi:MAG: hypothetical protein AB1515_01595 [Nitrospirota bacterium]